LSAHTCTFTATLLPATVVEYQMSSKPPDE